LQCHEALGENAFDLVEIAEDVVTKAVFAQCIPKVFGRVELRAAGPQEHQPHVGRHGQLARDAPTRLVHDHEDELGGVALGETSARNIDIVSALTQGSTRLSITPS
jgi:hypothetical protein